MREGAITLSPRDQRRIHILLALERDQMTAIEAASVLGISTRQVRALRARLRSDGTAGVIHRNRGRRPANALAPSVAETVVGFARSNYEGFNQTFFTEMLEREEGVLISRSTTRRMLAADGIGAPRPQKRSRHRRHRVRRAQCGALIQMDGSDHDWLCERGPRLTLVGGIDDATGQVWATFRLHEDTQGYFELLVQITRDCGRPQAVYLDRTTIALGTKRTPERVRTGTIHYATQMTRVLDRLDIGLIQARSPQAKGRIERLWRTLQDRLLCEMRAKGVRSLAGAQQLLSKHLASHNRNFAIAPLDPTPAWRPLDPEQRVEDAVCWTYSRTVTNDNTVSVEGAKFQLEFPTLHPGWARRRVQLCRRLDGSWFARSFTDSVPITPIAHPAARERAA